MVPDVLQHIKYKIFFDERLSLGNYINSMIDREEYSPCTKNRKSCVSSDENNIWEYYCKRSKVRIIYSEEEEEYYFESLFKGSFLG